MTETPPTTQALEKTTRGLERIETTTLILTVVAASGAFALAGSHRAAGVMIGGVLGAANFWLLRVMIRLFFVKGGEEAATRSRKTRLVLLALGKFVAFYGLVALLFMKTPMDQIGFLIGFSMLVLAITGNGLRAVPVSGSTVNAAKDGPAAH